MGSDQWPFQPGTGPCSRCLTEQSNECPANAQAVGQTGNHKQEVHISNLREAQQKDFISDEERPSLFKLTDMYERVPTKELAMESMSCPLTPKSHSLISPREFTRMLDGLTSETGNTTVFLRRKWVSMQQGAACGLIY